MTYDRRETHTDGERPVAKASADVGRRKAPSVSRLARSTTVWRDVGSCATAGTIDSEADLHLCRGSHVRRRLAASAVRTAPTQNFQRHRGQGHRDNCGHGRHKVGIRMAHRVAQPVPGKNQ